MVALVKQEMFHVCVCQGMVDPGENELSGTAIREFCEEALEGNDHSKLTPEERKQHRDEMVKRFVEHKKIDAPVSHERLLI